MKTRVKVAIYLEEMTEILSNKNGVAVEVTQHGLCRKFEKFLLLLVVNSARNVRYGRTTRNTFRSWTKRTPVVVRCLASLNEDDLRFDGKRKFRRIY